MWIFVLIGLLLGAQLNLTAIVPLQPGGTPPPWWVGGRLIWPFAVETRTQGPNPSALGDTTACPTPPNNSMEPTRPAAAKRMRDTIEELAGLAHLTAANPCRNPCPASI